MINGVNGSLNMNQASMAVVGGVKYIMLLTLVALPLRIKINNKLIAPIEINKIDQIKEPIISFDHSISCVSNNNAATRLMIALAAN